MFDSCEMPTTNATTAEIAAILREAHIIAVVGLSDKPERDSYHVAAYLQQQGYRIIPVNPAVSEVLGEKSYALAGRAGKDRPRRCVSQTGGGAGDRRRSHFAGGEGAVVARRCRPQRRRGEGPRCWVTGCAEQVHFEGTSTIPDRLSRCDGRLRRAVLREQLPCKENDTLTTVAHD